MSDIRRILWIVTKGVILLIGLGAILAGGICGAMVAPGALGHEAMARDIFQVCLVVVAVGLVIAIPAWRSLRRDRQAAKARLETEIEEIRRRQEGKS